ncbi:MAG: hypothetical protein AAF481_10935 [Acidobacteriota bacterium]
MHDTSPEAERVQAEVHRRMSGPEKVRIAMEMSEAVREIARTRIRAHHPEWDEDAVRDELPRELDGFRCLR